MKKANDVAGTDNSDYVLGTDHSEIERLGIQHRAWAPTVRETWRRAGFKEGDTILDLGAGPGYASTDLAELVGSAGRVVAIEKSTRFIDVLERSLPSDRRARIDILHRDLDSPQMDLPPADGSWCRWVLMFLRHRTALLAHLHRAVRPGGVAVFHEYGDYRTWRMSPPCAELEQFVGVVLRSWVDQGGDPDVGLHLPRLLEDAGFDVVSVRPITRLITSADPLWGWVCGFFYGGLSRLIELGYIDASSADAFKCAFTVDAGNPGARMLTPVVMEVVAIRRAGRQGQVPRVRS